MIIDGKEYTSVWLEEHAVKLINQNQLPFRFEIITCESPEAVAEAIQTMMVRGAPAIGAAGAYAMALAAQLSPDWGFRNNLRAARELLIAARPTAVDLSNGVNAVYESALKWIPDLTHARQVARQTAVEFTAQSAEDCRMIGEAGQKIIQDGMRILTHCNAGALATVDWGTALAVIRIAHRTGKRMFIYIDETRPRFQGSRLTAFELAQEGIPHAIIVDNAAGYYMQKGEIDLVITGADRVCMNGDIANKIGTYEKAVLAKEHRIPFYIAAPFTTFDFTCMNGFNIPIEERDSEEVTHIGKELIANPGSTAYNPVFDITPAKYITGIITSKGIFKPEDAASQMNR